MARMFSTEFIYKEKPYTATVVISGVDGEKTIAIQVPRELHAIVPEGKLVVDAAGKAEGGLSKDPALLKSILTAVEKHEETEPPLGLGSVWS
jgi:hypothetical protein